MTRRDAGWLIARVTAVAGSSEFFGAWLRGAPMQPAMHSSAPPDPHDWSSYRPAFFSPREYEAVEVFSAILIPSDDTPGAREAHVAPFIDFVLNAAAEFAPDMQAQWRQAAQWLVQRKFAALDANAQVALVEQMAASGQHPGHEYFRLMKEMTVHAFYSSRVGLVDALEYKGLAYLTEFPGCTHPEHQQV
ncbi:MAG: gluconate 2-dehydrogenase subunit 3 family protein [Acidobacteriaceae bacterium]|nr:gluconate 2-dehydrogenase subunit 3 family protein [Acidobacteriaceae bacterium]